MISAIFLQADYLFINQQGFLKMIFFGINRSALMFSYLAQPIFENAYLRLCSM